MPINDNWKPGNRYFEYLELDEYLKCLKVRVPLHALVGRTDGPTLFVQACQHGTEINGWEAARQVLERVTPETLRGTLVVIPAAQPVALQGRMHDYPDSTHNMNRTWPGRADGAFHAERLAAMIFDRVVSKADMVIDLHCWGHDVIPLTWNQPGNRLWNEAFGWTYLGEGDSNRASSKLEHACLDAGIPYLPVEMVPQDRIDRRQAAMGRTGTMNVMRYMGMIAGPMQYPPRRYVFQPYPQHHQLTAQHEGMWVPAVPKATMVDAGQVVGRVYDWETLRVLEEVTAPVEGFLYSDRPPKRRNRNLVEPGDLCVMLWEVEKVLTPADGPEPGAWSK